MSDNPFAEPEDRNQTIIRPDPRRRRASSVAASGGINDVPAPLRQVTAAAAGVAEGAANVRIGDEVLLWFSVSLNAAADGVYASLQSAPPERMPTISTTEAS